MASSSTCNNTHEQLKSDSAFNKVYEPQLRWVFSIMATWIDWMEGVVRFSLCHREMIFVVITTLPLLNQEQKLSRVTIGNAPHRTFMYCLGRVEYSWHCSSSESCPNINSQISTHQMVVSYFLLFAMLRPLSVTTGPTLGLQPLDDWWSSSRGCGLRWTWGVVKNTLSQVRALVCHREMTVAVMTTLPL